MSKKPLTPKRIAQLKRLHELTRQRMQTAEWRQKKSDENKGKKRSPETCRRIADSKRGKKRKPFTTEWRQNMREAQMSSPKTKAHLARLAELNRGTHLSEEEKQTLSEALSESPKHRAHMVRLHEARRGKHHSAATLEKISKANSQFRKTAGASGIELFMRHCLGAYGGHQFQTEAEIPGFFEMSGRHKKWDILLPNKKIAIELDGSRWHSFKTTVYTRIYWDVAREYQNEHYAEWLGWRVIRIAERVLKASKPFKNWFRIQRLEHRQIRAACKPPRLQINLATKAVKAKRAHFERVKTRKGVVLEIAA